MIGAGICAGLAGLGCYGVHRGAQKAKEIAVKKDQYKSKIVAHEDLHKAPDGSFMVSATPKDGNFVELYKQYIHTETTYTPVRTLGLGVGVDLFGNIGPSVQVHDGIAQHQHNSIGYESSPFKQFLTTSTFGLSGMNSADNWRNNMILGMPTKEVSGDGATVQALLKNEYKTDVPLKSQKVYKSKVWNLVGQPLYFTGTKYGSGTYMWNSVAKDPETATNTVFAGEESEAGMMQVGGGVLAFTCGIIGAVCLASKL